MVNALLLNHRLETEEQRLLEIDDLQVGKAGEYLVCADLILKGYVAFPSEQGLSFDVVLVANKLYKMQVKTTRKPMPVPKRREATDKYQFQVRRCGKGGRRSYEENEVDIFALVALDTKMIGYIKAEDIKQTMFFLPENVIPMRDATGKKENIIKLRNQGYSYDKIAEALSVDRAYAYRVVKGKENKSFSRNYLSNFTIQECLK